MAGILFTAVVIGTLVGTILYVAFSTGGSSDLKQGVVNLSLIAIVPTLAGVRLAHQNFIVDHRPTLRALKNLGVSNAFFQRHLVLQAVLLTLVAAASAVVLGRLIADPFFRLLFIGMNKRLPDVWGSPQAVLATAPVVMMFIYLIGVGTIRFERVLEGSTDSAPRSGAWRKAGLAVGYVALALNFGVGVWSIATGGSNAGVALMVISAPVVAAVLAAPIGRLIGGAVSTVLSRVVGWTAPSLGIRSIDAAGTITRTGLAAVLLSIPLSGFTWAYASLDGGSFYAQQSVSEVPIVVSQEKQLLHPAQAEAVCDELGQGCHGVVYWQPSDILGSGEESVERKYANDYTLSATSSEVLNEFLPGQIEPEGDNPFHFASMKLAEAVSVNPPVNPDWALAVVDGSAQVSDDYRVVPAKEWASNAGNDTQIFFGPNGDGTSGFIPLVAYTLLAICVILLVEAIGRREGLRSFFAPLHLLGKTQTSIQLTTFWAILFPYLTAILAALLASFWYEMVAYFVTTGEVGAWMPFMPAGLWVLFVLVFLLTSATAFLPTPRERIQS
ncbi:hypothetical protein C3E79_03375 [Corynebacterium liangguodongii]|uniref:ABC3 transporter permease C-terminal domain-containing protein n=2 Tax=Corynebacterium liangguodongii TaxID=2079535 RepID=A0A2S0WD22_9CORY|nr:hypothetical protein C3E79_03375 [Corynebacterium liangguodongii]PWB99547.1 hypothetical protein DF219_06420 [Corynebacterium liangguodongii]